MSVDWYGSMVYSARTRREPDVFVERLPGSGFPRSGFFKSKLLYSQKLEKSFLSSLEVFALYYCNDLAPCVFW